MHIIAKAVKETLLIPYRVVQGAGAALDEAVNGKKKAPKR